MNKYKIANGKMDFYRESRDRIAFENLLAVDFSLSGQDRGTFPAGIVIDPCCLR